MSDTCHVDILDHQRGALVSVANVTGGECATIYDLMSYTRQTTAVQILNNRRVCLHAR